MHITNVSEAKAQLSKLLQQVAQGKEVIIGRAGKPIARLVPYDMPSEPREPGALRGQIRISNDFDSLPYDIADSFGMVAEGTVAEGTESGPNSGDE